MRIFFVLLLMSLPLTALAGYDKNIEGNVTHIYTYPTGLVLFKLANQPSSHPACRAEYFAIGTDVKEGPANRMFSRLLTLHTSKTKAYIGYDSQGNCANGYIRVHNIGGG